MNTWPFVALMIAAGTLIAFQSPINGALSRRTGVLEATLMSFVVGGLLAFALVVVMGRGNVKAILGAPIWQWLGGVLGCLYVTLVIVSVSRVGVTTVMVAGLLGQLATALAIDHFGWLGMDTRPLTPGRLLGIPLLFASLWLFHRSG
ncbi:MAG: DMT family transporter [Myxococcaceae bacterium]